jgi:hypothetical protein
MSKIICKNLIVTFTITLTLTYLNIGLKELDVFFIIWIRSWFIASTIALLFNLYIYPILFDTFFTKRNKQYSRLLKN